MADDSKDKTEATDWDFQLDEKPKKEFKKSGVENSIRVERKSRLNAKVSALSTDENETRYGDFTLKNNKKRRSRSALASQMNEEDESEFLEDYEASMTKRFLCSLFDLISVGIILFFVSTKWNIIEETVLKGLRDLNISQLLDPIVFKGIILSILFFFSYYVYVSLTFKIFKKTLGKRVFNLNVYKKLNNYDNLDGGPTVLREVIVKPLSVLTLIGFIYPLLKQSHFFFHDKVLNTIVIDHAKEPSKKIIRR